MLNIIQERWNEILEKVKIEHAVTDVSFRTWLKPLKVHSITNNVVIILVSDAQLGTEFVSKKYSIPLKVSIEEVIAKAYDVKFILPSEIDSLVTEKPQVTENKQTNSLPAASPLKKES